MGRHLLQQLATSGTGKFAGAVGALCAELEAAEWDTPMSALSDYPNGKLDGHRLEIPLANGARVELVINCGAGVVLVEAVG